MGLLRYYSQVILDDDTANKLISGEEEIPKLSQSTESLRDRIWAQSADGEMMAEINDKGDLEVVGTHGRGRIFNSTSIKNAFGLLFSPDNKHIVAFSDKFLSINPIIKARPDIIYPIIKTFPDIKYQNLERVISIPTGIAFIRFEGNDLIVISGPDGKETKYDLKSESLE